jgi:hypothetical protein
VFGRGRRPLVGAALAAVCATSLAACSRGTEGSAPTTSTTATTTVGERCPLTDLPAPNGVVPPRPALAVKVDNYVAARPQSGLDDADIVFEEPVEGGITRLVAVFQCENAPSVGPIRSARNIDIGILGQFGQPLLVNVGGIDPVLANIADSPIIENDLRVDASVVENPPGRVAPYDTYASTAALWAQHPTVRTPPSPVFQYSVALPSGTPATSVSIPYGGGQVVWNYDPATRQYRRSYGSSPDVLADGAQNSAANVIVQVVQVTYGPWLENDEGGLEVQANLYEDASGPAELFRDGIEVAGTWSRDSLSAPTSFVSASGIPFSLRPGRTWVELVPSTIPVGTLAPPGAP